MGTLIGAPLADRWGHKKFLQVSLFLSFPLLLLFYYSSGFISFILLGIAGMVLISSFALTTVMGQAVLPQHLGMASGMMVGFTMSAGGIGVTLLGIIADSWGVPMAMKTILILPLIASGLALMVKYPLKIERRMMKTILVTGGAGFIGSHLCERLLEEGHSVICLDNFDSYYDPNLKIRNVEEISRKYPGPFTMVTGDIRNRDHLKELFKRNRIDAVFHLAARAGVRPSIADPLLYEDVNLRGTITLLEVCKEFGMKNFIFASSSSVYGENQRVPFSETISIFNPSHPMGPPNGLENFSAIPIITSTESISPAFGSSRPMVPGRGRRWPFTNLPR